MEISVSDELNTPKTKSKDALEAVKGQFCFLFCQNFWHAIIYVNDND